ncbi:5-hydroxyisourate hydrolase [Mycolicibacterium vanbaalenii]|uniref:5-hydroxyisourate hydrolase n=1 Tax=Mycolicibacterium vanbaalenii TaxID=110539 RepID=A0A5S9RB08_MYCVN|nr:hydroxyisourate hydrolase [Mycolicibacterium vanbaalenii]CAA0136462.1 5-hydroxyisourate hydrolase [Mycolicibacterium vanbaalenii]
MKTLSTHVLDAMTGTPAVGVGVTVTDTSGGTVAVACTDDDGRVTSLATDLTVGVYRLRFDTGGYFAATDVTAFYPEVVIAFEITDTVEHYHVPLLLSPFAYSTYRGS